MSNNTSPFAPGGPDGPPLRHQAPKQKSFGEILGIAFGASLAISLAVLALVAMAWATAWLLANMPT